jgi:DNA-binding MarR family transcriptional regulator
MTAAQIFRLEELDVSNTSRMKVILALETGPKIMSAVATLAALSTAGMTSIADGMAKSNLVTRTRHATDRRSIQIGLTTKGRAALEILKS